jgi:hypothetical protein
MAAIQFPAGAVENDIFTYEGRSWKYDGVAWVAISATSQTSGSTGSELKNVDIVNLIESDYTIQLDDNFKVKLCKNLDSITVTFSDEAAASLPIGSHIEFIKFFNDVLFAASGNITINQSPGGLTGNYGRAVALKTEETEWFISFYESTDLSGTFAPQQNPVFSGQVRVIPDGVFSPLGTTGTINLNFEGDSYKTQGPLTGDIVYTGSNYQDGSNVTVKVLNGSTERNLTFPIEWKFVGTKPATIAADKIAILTITVFNSITSDIVAAWAAEE